MGFAKGGRGEPQINLPGFSRGAASSSERGKKKKRKRKRKKRPEGLRAGLPRSPAPEQCAGRAGVAAGPGGCAERSGAGACGSGRVSPQPFCAALLESGAEAQGNAKKKKKEKKEKESPTPPRPPPVGRMSPRRRSLHPPRWGLRAPSPRPRVPSGPLSRAPRDRDRPRRLLPSCAARRPHARPSSRRPREAAAAGGGADPREPRGWGGGGRGVGGGESGAAPRSCAAQPRRWGPGGAAMGAAAAGRERPGAGGGGRVPPRSRSR